MTTLNQFIGSVKEGMAKTSHFTVSMTLPEAISNMPQINMQKVILFCDQAPLPGTSLGTAQVRSYGEFREVPYERLYEPVTLSFYVDANMTVKFLFDIWMNLVQDEVSRDFNYPMGPKGYITDSIDIVVKNNESEGVYVSRLFNCYVKSIAPIQLDYAGKDVMKLSVTLMYQYYRVFLLTSSRSEESGAPIQLNNDLMQEYNYGYDASNVVPENYYTDFLGFQNSVQDLDFYSGELLTTDDTENIGEFTGFGGVFT